LFTPEEEVGGGATKASAPKTTTTTNTTAMTMVDASLNRFIFDFWLVRTIELPIDDTLALSLSLVVLVSSLIDV